VRLQARGGDIRFNSRMTGSARDQAALLPLTPGVLERTPPDWAPFAKRKAELAARLTGG
jgi:hypothetical protein